MPFDWFAEASCIAFEQTNRLVAMLCSWWTIGRLSESVDRVSPALLTYVTVQSMHSSGKLKMSAE